MKRIAIIISIVLAMAGLRIQAQDAMFSQYYANPLYLNPAFAGTNVCPRLAFHFRDQWPSMPGRPLCPPAEPRVWMRIFPIGSAASSETTSTCCGGIL